MLPFSRRAGRLVAQNFLHRGLPSLDDKAGILTLRGGADRYQYRQFVSPSKPLLGRPPTDESIIASNQEFLIKSLCFNKDQMAKLQSSSINILTLENGVLRERVNWLKERLNLKKKSDIMKITHRAPDVLGLLPDTNLAPKLDYLQKRLKLDKKSLRKLILDAPSVFSYNIEDNIEPKLDWLQERLKLDDLARSKIIQTMPQILGLSIPDNLEPKLSWLQQRLDLDNSELGKMIQTMPSILGYSIPDNLEPTLNWLQQRFALDNAALSKMIQTMPPILGLSTSDNLEPKLDWLQRSLSLTDVELSNLVQKMPALLGYNVDTNLEPTLNFYIDALGDKGKALALVIRDPSFFTRSLEKRLKPRLKEACDAGLTIDAGCLQRIGKCTDEKWRASLVSQAKKLSRRGIL